MGPKHTNEEVWGLWLNLGGYPSGASFFVGLIGPVFAFMGADGATHMSEEVRKPRTTIPYALITSITLNGFLGFGMIIALLYCQGSIKENLATPSGFPFLGAFLQALQSLPWATAYTSLLLVLLIFANVAVLAATFSTASAQSRTVPLDAFTSIVACLPFNFVIAPSQGTTYQMIVDADTGVAAAVNATVANGVLTLALANNAPNSLTFKATNPIKVAVQ